MRKIDFNNYIFFCSYNFFRLDESIQVNLKKMFVKKINKFKKDTKLPIVSKNFKIHLKFHKEGCFALINFDVSDTNNIIEISLEENIDNILKITKK